MKAFRQIVRAVTCGSLFFLVARLPAQQLSHWSESEGLSNRRISHAIQDRDGFIWIATVNGLNRFNGYNFLVYDKSNLPGLCSGEVNCLLLDSKQRLWIGTAAGLNIMDVNTHKILRGFKRSNYRGALLHDNINAIAETAEHNIFITTVDGYLYKYASDSSFVAILNPAAPDGSFGRRTTLTSLDGSLYIRSDDRGGCEINLKSLKPVSRFGERLKTHHGSVNRLGDSVIVVSADEGALVYSAEHKNLIPLIAEKMSDVFFTLMDYKGDYWFAAGERKHLWRYSQGVLADVSNLLFDFTENVHISCIFEDSSHNLWICTGSGIYKLSNERPLFVSILRKDQFVAPNYISSFRGMMEDSLGTIFIGGYGGLFRLDKSRSLSRLFDNKIPYSPYILIDKNKEELWALCEGFGIICVNKTTGKVNSLTQKVPRPPDGGGQYFVSGIMAKDGKFWIGSYEGLMRYDPRTNQLFSQRLSYKEHTFSDYVFKHIYRSSNGNLWFCGSKGVFVIDENNRPVAHYDKDESGKYNLPFSSIRCVYEAKDNTMWLGSENGGLVLLSDTGYRVINTTHRLADNAVASILQDNHESVWVATNNGLTQINPNGKVTNFYTEQGLSSNEFNGSSVLKTQSGLLLFGGVNGINICDPDIEYKNQTIDSRIVLSKAEVPLDEYHTQFFYNDTELKKGIQLSHNLGYLYFEFFVNDYLRSSKNSYEYILEGHNDKWVSLGEQNSLRFAGITSGKYTLKVRAANSRGSSIGNQLVIPIIIKPVFYKTWWFIALSVLLFTAILTSFIFVRFRRFKEQSEMRIKIASDLHDDVGSVLTKIAMQADILEDDLPEENKPLIQSISASSRAAITNMRDMVWSIDARNKNVGSLFDKLSDHAHQMFEAGKFSYALLFDESLKSIQLTPMQKQETYYIFKEAINNLLKYSNGNKVEIKAFRENAQFILSIYDNGNSEGALNKAGSGIKNMEMRAARIGGELSFITKNGYLVTLKVPLATRYNIFG